MFRMIGQYEIARDGDVIRVRSAPEFNLEAAQQYARDMLEVIAQVPPKFAALVEFESPPIIGPEVEEAMHRSAKVRAERGMQAVAFVTQGVEAIAVANAQWGRIHAGTSARAWLQELLGRGH